MELRVKRFLATNPYPVFLADKDGRVLYSNETGEPLLQELGTGIGEKLPPFIGDFVHRAISSNKAQRTELKVEKSIYLFLFQPSKVENSVNIYGFDVTDQRKFEDTFKITQENLVKAQKNVENIIEERAIQLAGSYNLLKESEKELVEAYKIAHIGTWEWEIATDLTYWSDEMFHIFRRAPIELAPSYNEYLNYVHHDDQDYVDNAFKKSTNGEPFSIDYRIILANGEERTVHMQSEVIIDEKNIPIRIKGFVQDITERTKSIEKIKTYANIVELSNDAIITKSLDGIITTWNKGAEQIYGYSAEEIMGKNLSILAPDDHKGGIEQLTEEIDQGKKIQNYETLRVRKDGTLINVSLTLSPVYDASGKLTAISVIARDITESKRAEENIKKSEKKYRNIVETANEGICIIDDEAMITYVNKKMKDMLGYNLEEIIGRPIWNFISEEGKAIAKLILEKRRQGIDESHEFELIRQDGSPLWTLINAKSLFDKDGKFMGSLGMFTDITERKHAEEALRRREEELREAQRIAHVGSWYWDAKTDVNTVSDELLRIFGQACPPFKEQKGTMYPPESWERLNAVVQRAVQTGVGYELDLEALHGDGYTIWITTRSETVRDANGMIIGLLGTVQDITERKRAEQELRESEKRYRTLFENMLEGFAYCRVLYDDSGYPVDFIYLDTNSAFERLTGLKELTGKRVTEAIPGIKELHPELFDAYGRVALTGQPERFELEFKPLGIWLWISVYSLEREHFVAVFDNITERKKAEEKIQNLANIVESSNDAIVTESLEGIVTSWNKGAEQVYGYSAKEILGNTASILESDDCKGEIKQLIEKIKQGEEIKNYETLRLRKDGKIIYVSITLSPVLDIHEKLTAISAIARDITERKRAEEALRSSNIYNRSLIEASLDPLVTIGHDGKITDVNISTEFVTGYSRDELISTDFTNYFTEPEKAKEGYQSVFQEGLVRDYPLEIHHKDGLIIPVLYNASVYKNEAGEVIGVFAAARDITKRKKAEEKLRESEEKYRNIVETANEGICIIDDEAIVTYVNKKMMDMLGYNLEEIIGRPIWNFISEEGKAILKLNMEKRRQGINEVYEFKLICKDGSPLWTLANSKSLFDKDGKFMGAISMLIDITKRKEAEEALSNIEIARKQEIHHRIKNNLQVISSLLDLQAEKFGNRECIKDSEVKEAFRKSQDRVISMALIHEELYKGGGLDTLNFSSYIKELAENLFLTYRLRDTDISLNMDLEENIFLDMDTAVPLGIIINELISNSLKHAFQGRNKGEIRIKFHKEENGECINSIEESKSEGCKSTSFTLIVSDNGVGIPENLDIEDLDTLGLQLVTSLVDQLDGELEMKRNNGTEFIIRFTVLEKSNQASATAPQ